MSLPALRALRSDFPRAGSRSLLKPWVADLYRRESFCERIDIVDGFDAFGQV
jgi:hypothetical protein